MKQVLLIATIIILLFSCSKPKTGGYTLKGEMEVVKEYGWSYLKFEGKFYEVCNDLSMLKLKDGARVKAVIKEVAFNNCHYQVPGKRAEGGIVDLVGPVVIIWMRPAF